jgi:hypothetical protein
MKIRDSVQSRVDGMLESEGNVNRFSGQRTRDRFFANCTDLAPGPDRQVKSNALKRDIRVRKCSILPH